MLKRVLIAMMVVTCVFVTFTAGGCKKPDVTREVEIIDEGNTEDTLSTRMKVE